MPGGSPDLCPVGPVLAYFVGRPKKLELEQANWVKAKFKISSKVAALGP